MANVLTGLMPTLYAALDRVSREMVGFIPSVAVNAAPTQAALGEKISIPATQTAEAYDITPGMQPADNGDQKIGTVDMEITKSRAVPIKWNGEEQLGVGNSGTYNTILADQFTQAMRALTNEVDRDLALLYSGASRGYGTPGTTPFASGVGDTAQIRKIMEDNGAPMTDLQLVINTTAGAALRSNAQLTKANEAGTDATLRRGELLNINGFSIRESGQIRLHTAGSVSGALVNNPGGYKVGATSIAYDTGTADLKAGDLVKFGSDGNLYVIPSVSAVSPLLIAAPGLVSDVADDANLTTEGPYTPNLAFDRNALQLIARTPAMPNGGDAADDVTTITDPVSGISFQVAVYRLYRQVKFEIGIAWGVKLIKPEHVAILVG